MKRFTRKRNRRNRVAPDPIFTMGAPPVFIRYSPKGRKSRKKRKKTRRKNKKMKGGGGQKNLFVIFHLKNKNNM